MKSPLGKTLVYLYLLRFSLLLWLFPPVFALLDSGWLPVSTKTLSRGIFVPEYWSGFLCVTFFLIAGGFVFLITARTVAINGSERFGTPCPDWLKGLLANDEGRGESKPVLLSLIPTAMTLVYLLMDSPLEGVQTAHIIEGIVVGTAAAGLFWYVINAWYYLTYEPEVRAALGDKVKLGVNAARTILFPRRAFWLKRPGAVAIDGSFTLEDIATQLRSNRLVRFTHCMTAWLGLKGWLPGYIDGGGRIYEAQVFSGVAAGGFIVLFWVLYPLTAPIPTRWVLASFAVILASLIAVVRIFLGGRCNDPKVLRRWKWGLISISIGFCLIIPSVWYKTDPARFPTLASVLLLVILQGWTFSGLAFFLDRFRIPVLTLVILSVAYPRVFHLYGNLEEHYASTVELASNNQAPTPAQILSERLNQVRADDRPLIIVTATGGGLHASAWTTRVLRQLNDNFPEEEDRESFRSHILLMSTVSGGSVGAFYYLRELDLARQAPVQETSAGKPKPPNFDRMIVASQCSSLEAAGWGLVYYDFTKAVVPLAPYAPWMHPSPGNGDLDRSPLSKDRTWALRRGLERNSDNDYCYDSAKDLDDAQPDRPKVSWLDSLLARLWPRLPSTAKRQTLAGLAPIGGKDDASYDIPAFTMNTTTAEGGDRLLLANYRLPNYRLGSIEGQPAESFLGIEFPENRHADLPLASAAQLSATFPYVSSAVRIPGSLAKYSDHFVDGGYYDNDGTASAIEFLRYALDSPATDTIEDRDKDIREGAVKKFTDRNPLRILLIEIRNSVDSDAPGVSATPKALNPPGSDPAGLIEQLTKPLEGFWNAGHQSVTGRNRNGLDLFIQAHPYVALHQIVLDDAGQRTPLGFRFGIQEAQDPLSWSLTPAQRKEARDSSESVPMQDCYRVASNWFRKWEASGWQSPTRCNADAKFAPASVTRQVRESAPGDYLSIGFLKLGAKSVSFLNPETMDSTSPNSRSKRIVATATRLFTPPAKVGDVASNLGLGNDDGKELVAMRCRPPHPEKVDAMLATWPNVYLALKRDIKVPFGACTKKPRDTEIQLGCFANEVHDDANKRAVTALKGTFDSAGMAFDDTPESSKLAAWLQVNYGIASGFSGSGYSVAESDRIESKPMTSRDVLANLASSEYLLKNVSLADARCSCIAVVPYSGRSNDRLDPEFITQAGGQGTCAPVSRLRTGAR